MEALQVCALHPMILQLRHTPLRSIFRYRLVQDKPPPSGRQLQTVRLQYLLMSQVCLLPGNSGMAFRQYARRPMKLQLRHTPLRSIFRYRLVHNKLPPSGRQLQTVHLQYLPMCQVFLLLGNSRMAFLQHDRRPVILQLRHTPLRSIFRL